MKKFGESIWDRIITMAIEDYNRDGSRMIFSGCDVIAEIEKKMEKDNER